jgi:hypothetical protein
LFELSVVSGSRPIDLVEGVLTRDRKVATHKLALFRALCEIALTQPHGVVWRKGGSVGVPLASLADRWIVYYWAIFHSRTFLPQMDGEQDSRVHKLGFTKELERLMDTYAKSGGLTRFVLDRRSDCFPSLEIKRLYKTLMSKVGQVIIKGPVTYSGGSLGVQLFTYKGGYVFLHADLWRELSLMGHWIHEALILRWAQLISRLSKREIPPEKTIGPLLLRELNSEREQDAARMIYFQLPDLRCVWTGSLIKQDFHVDHMIPFALWRNNDLWNLLPAAPQVNR